MIDGAAIALAALAWSLPLGAEPAIASARGGAAAGLAAHSQVPPVPPVPRARQGRTVPRVVGLPLDSARAVLRRARLRLLVVDSVTSRGTPGVVRRQDPVGGRPVPRDRTVRVALTFRRVPVVDTAATVAVRPSVVLS